MSGQQLRHFAIQGNLSQLRNLIAGGTNPCSIDEQGMSALHFATWNGHIECVDFLLANSKGKHPETGEKCCCINFQTKSGYTALSLAVFGGVNGEDCCKSLLLAGANPFIADYCGKLPIDIAKRKDNHDIIDLLSNYEEMVQNEGVAFVDKINSVYKVRQRSHDLSRLMVDLDDILRDVKYHRFMKVPIAKELILPEELILPFAKRRVQSNRSEDGGTKIIKDLRMAVEESQKNCNRRLSLVNSYRSEGDTYHELTFSI